MNWLITGGGGFIGCNLVKYLLGKNQDIRILDNFVNGTRPTFVSMKNSWTCGRPIAFQQVFDRQVDIMTGSICDPQIAKLAVTDMDVVVHLAANTGVQPSIRNSRYDMKTNIWGTLNLLEACRNTKIKKFVFASSNAAVGEYNYAIHENLLPDPQSPYGVSKLTGEHYCKIFNTLHKVPTVVFRFSNIYGPFSQHKQSVIPKFIKAFTESKPVTVHGTGDQTRDFLHVDDLVEAIVKIVKHNDLVNGEIFQIGTGRETSINDLIKILSAIYSQTPEVNQTKALTGDVKRSCSNVSKAYKFLDWQPKINITDGLIQICANWQS